MNTTHPTNEEMNQLTSFSSKQANGLSQFTVHLRDLPFVQATVKELPTQMWEVKTPDGTYLKDIPTPSEATHLAVGLVWTQHLSGVELLETLMGQHKQ